MFRVLGRAVQRILRNERGNVFILFGATAIPLFLMMGGAVDFARYTRYKSDLASAVDAASLALARQPGEYTNEEATVFVTNYVESFLMRDDEFSVQTYDAQKIDNGYRVTASGTVRAKFLPVAKLSDLGVNLDVLQVNVLAEVRHSSQPIELALVFDNTGSMNCGNIQTGGCANNWTDPGPSSRIAALKIAAQTLVDSLMSDQGSERVKIALVPFEGDVNVGPSVVDAAYAGNPPSWLDWADSANAKYNGQNFDKFDLVANATCSTGVNCKTVGHKWLFGKLTAKDANVKWAGCVEMRAEPYDLLDTEPTTTNLDTLFVPRLWPDEPDSGNNGGRSYLNNYLQDKVTSGPAAAQKSLAKFTSSSLAWHSGMKDTSFPYEHGPNWGCPRPIVPLTSHKATIDSAIANMLAYYSTGTFIPTGLVWGWHVLSDTEPFTEGVAPGDENYEETLKAVILFTDGENVVTGTNNHNGSRFSGYNYTGLNVGGTYRLGSPTASIAVDNMDDKTGELCENVKSNATDTEDDDNIRLYTITFGEMSDEDEALMRDCASLDDSGDPLYFHAPNTTTLQGIFDEIGEDLSEIRLSM
jgi:Flp pilus assembly protein TadG